MESYMAQNNLELKLLVRSSPPFYAKQRTLSPEGKTNKQKKKQKKKKLRLICPVPAGPVPGRSPEFFAPAV